MSTVYTIVAVFIFVRMLMYLPIYVVLEAGSYKPSLTPVYSQYINAQYLCFIISNTHLTKSISISL